MTITGNRFSQGFYTLSGLYSPVAYYTYGTTGVTIPAPRINNHHHWHHKLTNHRPPETTTNRKEHHHPTQQPPAQRPETPPPRQPETPASPPSKGRRRWRFR
jgi:hypothetical protein